MNTPRALALGTLLLALGAAAGYWFAARPAPTSAPPAAAGAATPRVDPQTGRRVLYWHDPMVPGPRFDQPGKSPFMDMPLVPVYADEADAEGRVSIDPRLQQNLGVRTAEVTRQALAPRVDAVGTVAFDERLVAMVTARAGGYIDKLFVRAPLERVRAGQPLAELLAPEWVAAQEEYLALARSPGTDGLRQAARQRLEVLGMPEAVIREVERSGQARPRVTLAAPIDGVIGELTVREGMTVAMGAPLFRINGLARVWVYAEVPEAQAARVRPGSAVAARVPAYPGETFSGRVAALLPEVDPATRSFKARIEVDNPKGLLMPGMFASVDLAAASAHEVLAVPSEALIRGGRRDRVILALGAGKFQPVEVEAGIEADGLTEIRQGLSAGQRVVVSAQFLIDSEASLKATLSRLDAAPPAAASAPAAAETRP